MNRSVARFLCVVFVLSSASAQAHEMRPGYVQIRETTEDVYDVLWKVPARGVNQRLGLYLRFGDDVDQLADPVNAFVGNAHVQRLRVRREGGLTGTPITIDGLAGTFTDVLLRLERLDGTFGSGFSQELDKLEIGPWLGPVPSGLGFHLIRIDSVTKGRLPELSEIRPIVQREWSNAKRLAVREETSKSLLQNYDVVIQWPEQTAEAPDEATTE